MKQPPHIIPKVVLIANSAWNVYNFRMNLIESLKEQGYSIVVFAPEDEYSPAIRDSGLCKLVPLQNLKPTHTNPIQDFLLLRELYVLLKKEKPDAVFTFTLKPNIFGSIVAKWLSILVIPTVTGLGYSFLHKSWLNWVVRRLYHFAFKGLDKVVFHNQSDYAVLKDFNILHHGQGIVVGGSGVDTEYFQPSPVPNQRPFVFLFLGRLLYDKGLMELVAAASRLHKDMQGVQFWVAGAHQAEHPAAIPPETFQHWVDEGVIQYFGQVEDVRPLIAKANVVVLPSYREGMPRAILEAMAMGRPVIATDVPGCRDAIRPGWNGWLAESRNVRHLEECLRKAMLEDDAILQKMGKNGRERAIDLFDLQQVKNQYLSILHSLNYIHAEVSIASAERTPGL